jgi:hypothetical protein
MQGQFVCTGLLNYLVPFLYGYGRRAVRFLRRLIQQNGHDINKVSEIKNVKNARCKKQKPRKAFTLSGEGGEEEKCFATPVLLIDVLVTCHGRIQGHFFSIAKNGQLNLVTGFCIAQRVAQRLH